VGSSPGQAGLGCTPGGGATGAPRSTRLGELGQGLCARERPGGAQARRARGARQLGPMGGDELAEGVRVTTLALEGLQQPGQPGLVGNHQGQPPVVEGRALLPTGATGEGQARLPRLLITVRAAIDMEARTVERSAPGGQAPTRGRRGGNEAGECGHANGVQRRESAPECVIVEMARLHAWGKAARARLMLETMGHEIARVMEKAEAVEPQGFARMTGGHKPPCRGLRGGSLHDCSDATCCKHGCDQTHVLSDLGTVRLWRWRDVRAVRVSPSLRRCRGMVAAPKNYAMTCEWCGIAAFKKPTLKSP